MDAGSGGATEESFWTCNLKRRDLDAILADNPERDLGNVTWANCKDGIPAGYGGRDDDLRTKIFTNVDAADKTKMKLLSKLLEIKDAWRYFVYRPVRIPNFEPNDARNMGPEINVK